jgi:hypothetical protein
MLLERKILFLLLALWLGYDSFDHIRHHLVELGGVFGRDDRDTGLCFNRLSGVARDLASGAERLFLKQGKGLEQLSCRPIPLP